MMFDKEEESSGFTIPHLKKISHDIETNLMSGNTLFFQLINLTAFMEGHNKHRNQCWCRLIGFIILKWSARKITEGQHVEERSMTMTKILYTLTRGPLDVEALVFSLPSL